MQDIIYEVFETDADYEHVKLVHQGFHRDIAESIMLKYFKANGGLVDYIMINHYSNDLLSACWSQETLSKRGECSQ